MTNAPVCSNREIPFARGNRWLAWLRSGVPSRSESEESYSLPFTSRRRRRALHTFLELEMDRSIVARPASGSGAQKAYPYSSQPARTEVRTVTDKNSLTLFLAWQEHCE
jgi:hypothetical protein